MLAAPSGVAEASIAPGRDVICQAKPYSNWGACPTDVPALQRLESTCRAERRRPLCSWEGYQSVHGITEPGSATAGSQSRLRRRRLRAEGTRRPRSGGAILLRRLPGASGEDRSEEEDPELGRPGRRRPHRAAAVPRLKPLPLVRRGVDLCPATECRTLRLRLLRTPVHSPQGRQTPIPTAKGTPCCRLSIAFNYEIPAFRRYPAWE